MAVLTIPFLALHRAVKVSLQAKVKRMQEVSVCFWCLKAAMMTIHVSSSRPMGSPSITAVGDASAAF